MLKISYTVPGIHCGHCVRTIKMELSELAGVEKVIADAQTKVVEISYMPPADEQKIKDLLTEINYPPEE